MKLETFPLSVILHLITSVVGLTHKPDHISLPLSAHNSKDLAFLIF